MDGRVGVPPVSPADDREELSGDDAGCATSPHSVAGCTPVHLGLPGSSGDWGGGPMTADRSDGDDQIWKLGTQEFLQMVVDDLSDLLDNDDADPQKRDERPADTPASIAWMVMTCNETPGSPHATRRGLYRLSVLPLGPCTSQHWHDGWTSRPPARCRSAPASSSPASMPRICHGDPTVAAAPTWAAGFGQSRRTLICSSSGTGPGAGRRASRRLPDLAVLLGITAFVPARPLLEHFLDEERGVGA